MKKFLKGLRYFLCYVAITLSTAVGVVVYQSNSAGSVSNGNLAGSTVGQVENNLMEVVTNLMDLESFNVNSSVSLTDTTKPSSTPINIDFDIDINLGAGFSTIEADGVFDIALNNETFDVAIRFVDNTFYVSALDQDIQFTTSGLVEGIGGVLALLDIDLPLDSGLMENFDVTALLGYMGEYKEVETETGYDINLEFMGYDIAMVCDSLFNLNSVVIENMAIEGFEIDLNLGLETYEQKVEITKPQHSFINLDTVTSLVNMAQDVLENNFVMADISASYEGISLDLNAKADFSDSFVMSLTTPAFEGINFSFKDGSLYANVGNLKVKGKADDISTIIDFVNKDLRANIESISPEVVETITSKTNEITSSITKELNNIDINKLLDYIDYLKITDNQIVLDIPDTAKVVIDIESGYITSIIASAYGVELTIDNISFDKQDIKIDTKDFVDFDKVFPTFKTFVNTLFTKGISGTMTFGRGNKTNSLNYGIRYTNHFETSFDTVVLSKTISVVSDNSKVYLMIDGVKVNVDLAEYQTIIDYINETFNQNISLPSFEMPEIDPYEMVVGAISSVDYLKAIDSGIELSIGGIVIQIISNENYIQALNVRYNDYSFTLNITGYGEVELFDIDKDEYLVFSDLTNYVDKATSFANNTSFNMHLGIMADINGTDITAMADGRVGLNGNVEAAISTTFNDFDLDFSMALTDDALGLTYDGLNLYAKQSSVSTLSNIIKNIVPNYVDIDSLLKQNNIDFDKTLSSDINLPAIDTKQLILAVKQLSLNQDTLVIEIDLRNTIPAYNFAGAIVVRMVNGGYELRIGGTYDDITASLYLKLTATEDFTASIPTDAIDVEDYLNLVEYVHNTIDSRNLALNINASVDNSTIDAKALVDFRSGLKAHISTESLGKPLTIAYADSIDEVLISFANLNLSGKLSNVNDILNFVQADLNDALVVYGINALEKITSQDVATTLPTVTFEDIKDILYTITFEDDKVSFEKDNISVVLTITNKTITNITLTINNITAIINISDNTETFDVTNTGFVAFDDVFPTLTSLVKTLTTKGISGNLTLSDKDKTLNLNYGLRYTNIFETSFDTTILGKTISVVTNAQNIYLAVDGIKVTTNISNYKDILAYINKTFALDITLPELNTQDIDIATLILGMVDSIDYLKAINGGIELSIGGIVVSIISNNNLIQTITVKYSDYTLSLNVTGYGEIELFDIAQDQYISFSDVTNYIDNAISFAKNTSFDVEVGAGAIIDNNIISANITGKANVSGNIIANITANYNDTEVSFGATLTNDALNINYDGLNVYGKLTAIDALTNLIKNVIPNYIDINKTLEDNGINLNKSQSQLKMPVIDYKALIMAVDSITLTQDTLTVKVDLANYDETIDAYITITATMIENGYSLAVNVVYNDIVANLAVKVVATENFSASIPTDAIDVEDYLNLVEYVHNTIDSRNLALDVTTTIKQTEIVAQVLADFRSTLKVKATTESLGSKLDVVYASDINKLLVTFGDIKISGKSSDLADILNFVKVDLNNALVTYGEKALAEANFESLTQSKDVAITFADIKDILHSITFGDDTISFVKDNIAVTLTITNKTISNIKLTIDDIIVNIDVSDNTQAITYTTTGYSAFENVLDNLKAITNVATSQAFGGKVTITYNQDKTYTGNLKVNYINNVLSVHIDSNVYDQDISIDIVGSTVYVKLNELKLQVSWAERYALQEYLNSKFDLQLDIDSIFNIAKGVASSTKDFNLGNINIDFISNFVANKNGLDITVSDIPVSFGIAKYGDTDKNYLSYISAGYDKFDILINEMAFGQDAIVNSVKATEYHKYTDFTKYFDEIERLIDASKDSATDQYTLKGGIKLYKLDTNGDALVTDGVADEITIAINDLKFDATKNTFVGGIDAKGSGSLYESYLSGYDHSFDAAYDYNFIYFDYNGLRAKFSKQSNSEFITTLKKMIPTYLGDSSLTRQLVSIFDMIKFDTMGNMLFNPIKLDVTFDMIEKFVPMLSTLRLEENGSLTIGIDISKFVSSFKEELLLNVSVDENGRLALVINKFKLTKDLAIDFTIYVDTASTFTVNPEGDYLDMTSIGKLLSDFDNTAQKTTTDNEVYKLNLSGSFHLKIEVSFIKINEDIPFKAQLIIDRNSSQLIEAKIEVDMPSIILVTDGCYSTLYLTNRLEGENILYIDRQGKDPLKSKYKVSELGANLINVISDVTAISASTLETFMTMDIKYIEGPSKAENVLKDYSCVTGINTRDYTIGLDLRQISRMDMMLGYSATNPTGVVIHSQNNAFTSIDINNITLEAISNVFIYVNGTIDLTKINQTTDIISEIESLDATLYGTWGDGSLVADFIENGGTNVPNKMGTTGRSFTLPVPVKEVVNGNTLEVYKFLGWSLNSDGSGELYSGRYMFETTSLTFYAVWELDTIYTSRTINFVSEYLMANKTDVKCENNISSITNYNGYDISNNLPTINDTVTIYYEDEGVSITYRYDGLFKTKTVNSDGTITYSDKFEQTVMPNEDLTLYASFVEIDRVYKRKLTILDESKTLYEGYFVEGEDIDILSLVTYKDTTRWYDDYDATAKARYTNEILTADLPTTMPRGNDLSLYVRNKYTITYTSNFGDKTTYTQTDYQGEALTLPTQTSYETIVYKEDTDSDGNKIPNYLSTFVYDGYTLSTNISVTAPSVIPNKNATYAAKWTNITTSYFKVTFSSPWVRPGSWLKDNQRQAPRATLTRYVLNGSTLNGTTLTKKNSIIGLAADQTENITDTCKYAYLGMRYTFDITAWNESGAVNHNLGSSTPGSFVIAGPKTFYGEWQCTGSRSDYF